MAPKTAMTFVTWIVSLIVLIFISFGIADSYRQGKLIGSQERGITFLPNKEYENLFSDNARKNLFFQVSRLGRTRSPFSCYTYDDKFSLIVYKIALTGNHPLDSVLYIEKGKIESPKHFSTSDVKWKDAALSYKISAVSSVDKIILRINTDSLRKITKNDSTEAFSLNGYFSIRYGKDSVTDLWTDDQTGVGARAMKPTSLLFLKRNFNIYFMLLSVEAGELLPEHLLADMINGEKQ